MHRVVRSAAKEDMQAEAAQAAAKANDTAKLFSIVKQLNQTERLLSGFFVLGHTAKVAAVLRWKTWRQRHENH